MILNLKTMKFFKCALLATALTTFLTSPVRAQEKPVTVELDLIDFNVLPVFLVVEDGENNRFVLAPGEDVDIAEPLENGEAITAEWIRNFPRECETVEVTYLPTEVDTNGQINLPLYMLTQEPTCTCTAN